MVLSRARLSQIFAKPLTGGPGSTRPGIFEGAQTGVWGQSPQPPEAKGQQIFAVFTLKKPSF